MLVQTKVHECSTYLPTSISKHTPCTNHNAHSSKLMSHVYTSVFDMHIHVIDFCAHMANVMSVFSKQVDILISKNQVWQILYLEHCVYKTTYHIAGKFGG